MLDMAKHRTTLEERFWKKVDKRGEDECWPWLGDKTANGYGQLAISSPPEPRVREYAHRFSYRLHKREPGKWVIRHMCHNPCCVNPKHLKRGTQVDNIKDMLKAKRGKPFGYPQSNHRHSSRNIP